MSSRSVEASAQNLRLAQSVMLCISIHRNENSDRRKALTDGPWCYTVIISGEILDLYMVDHMDEANEAKEM